MGSKNNLFWNSCSFAVHTSNASFTIGIGSVNSEKSHFDKFVPQMLLELAKTTEVFQISEFLFTLQIILLSAIASCKIKCTCYCSYQILQGSFLSKILFEQRASTLALWRAIVSCKFRGRTKNLIPMSNLAGIFISFSQFLMERTLKFLAKITDDFRHSLTFLSFKMRYEFKKNSQACSQC